MRFKTHVAFGILCALLTFRYFTNTLNEYILFFTLVFLGSVFPDIDIHNSWLNRKLKLTKLIALVTRHRGIFHSLIVAVPLSYLLYIVEPYFGFAFFIGYLSHLLMDSLNHMGIAYLHPIRNPHIKGFIEVGSKEETLIFLFIIIIYLWMAFQ